MKNPELNIAQRLWLEFLWSCSRLFAVMPYWFKYYVVENLIFFLLRYLIRYRMHVVMSNLRNSFPEKSDAEIAAIRNGFYWTLAEVAVNTINLAHMTSKKRHSLVQFSDVSNLSKSMRDCDWIALTAHFGCWEYYSFWGDFYPSQMVVAVYHPLRSAVIEELYRRLRNYDNCTTVAMKECLRFYLRNREQGIDGKRLAVGLIADQNPPKRPDSHWFRFLNQDTIFFDGGEKLALRCHLPVYFATMHRTRRGCYRVSFELIYDGEESVAPYEVTERYVRRLEQEISEHPELWMWSHRRWKHKRKNVGN